MIGQVDWHQHASGRQRGRLPRDSLIDVITNPSRRSAKAFLRSKWELVGTKEICTPSDIVGISQVVKRRVIVERRSF